MKTARDNGVTVLLDGQGGDENFAGYPYMQGFYLRGKLKNQQYGAFARAMINMLAQQRSGLALETLIYQYLSPGMRHNALKSRCLFLNEGFFNDNEAT